MNPRQKRLVQHIKSLTTAKIWYHTCGSCIAHLPELIDNGIDIINPVQISARDMAPVSLKARFGNKVTFWGGGVDTQHVLPFATPEGVREDVRKNMEAFKYGGGYVFNTVHNVQAGTPAENLLALYQAVRDAGQ